MGQQWKRQLLSTLLVTSHFCHILSQSYNDEAESFEAFDIPDSDTYPEDIQKRLSKFVRIGRGLSSFIRIGRQSPYDDPYFYQSANLPEATDDITGDSRNSAFLELDSNNFDNPEKRMSSFVRIGKNYNARNDWRNFNTVKRGGAFIRMGKFPSTAFLRNRPGRVDGLAPEPYYRRTGRIGHSSFIRIGKRDTTDALKQRLEQNAKHVSYEKNTSSKDRKANDSENIGTENRRYLKIGRDLFEHAGSDNEENKEIKTDEEHMQQVKSQENVDKRLSHFVRIGRGDTSSDEYSEKNAPEQKRLSNFVRIGKSDNIASKRISSFVRIGKRQNEEAEIAKRRRMSSFVRIGKSSIPLDENTARSIGIVEDTLASSGPADRDKRLSSFVRIGKNSKQSDDASKRFSSFVRIGKSGDDLVTDLNKRISSFVRIGRANPYDVNKRLSSFIRVGKNNPYIKDHKRFSSFVRIGKNYPTLADRPEKRVSSFVRIGKSIGDLEGDYDKRLSSFVRVGKDDFGDSMDFENGDPVVSDAAYRNNANNADKRVLSTFVRIGRDVDNNMDTHAAGNLENYQ